MWSASNSANLMLQDKLQPYLKKDNGSISLSQDEMHIRTLPWLQKLLSDYEETVVRTKATLSCYIEPDPAEIG